MATITNQAALSYNGVTTLSNIAVGELVEVLTATKTAADTTYTAGGIKTFVISLVNSSAAALTGLILNKLDGTAKGGIAVAIQSELDIPVKYIGVGESIHDLQKFDADQFVNALFHTSEENA